MLFSKNRTPSTPGKHYSRGSLHRCGEAFFRSRIAAAQRLGFPGSGVLRVGIPGPEKTNPGFAKGSDAVAPHSRTHAGKHPPWLIPPIPTQPPRITVRQEIALEPFAVTKAQAFRLIGQPRLVQRWLYWTRRSQPWLVVAREGQRKATLIDYASLKNAYQRYLAGEEPPRLPSELKSKK